MAVVPIEDRHRIASREVGRGAEQSRLDRLKGAEARNKLGQFATPNRLAVAIAARVLSLRMVGADSIRFLDPAVGSGSFYSALRQVVTGPIERATGVEVDPTFAESARELWGSEGLDVIADDFTRLEPPLPDQRANLILANPPYVRHHHVGLGEKQRLGALVREQVGIKVSGLAGLYVYFLLLADAWLAEGGLAAWLIPSEFMDVNYGSAVKDYLTGRVRLRQIHRFCPEDAQFGDALVTSAVVIFEKALPRASDEVLVTRGGSLDAPDHTEVVPIATLRAVRKWSSLPHGADRIPDATTTTTLGDLFMIRRGLATGSNAWFILPRAEARRLALPDRFLRPILPSPRYLQDAIIAADLDGFPRLDRALVLLDCDLPPEEVERDYPSLWTYLQAATTQNIPQGYLLSRRTPWYAQERRAVPPFLCTYMGRQRPGRPPFRFFWNRSQAVAANVYLLLYPRARLAAALAADPTLYPAIFDQLTAIRPARFVAEGRVYGGGLHKLEPKELAALPADAILALLNSNE